MRTRLSCSSQSILFHRITTMLPKILLILLLFLRGISSQEVFSVFAVVDHAAILPCDVSTCHSCHWNKIHPIISPVAKCIEERCIIEEDFRGRFTLADKINNGNYSLLLNSVKFNDKGVYECICDGITTDVRLQVDVSISLAADESGNITLPCYADTQTDVNDVTWLHNDKKVLHYLKDGRTYPGEGYEGRVSLTRDGFRYGDLSLTLTELQKTDTGLYRCFVDDEKTKGYPHAYMLHVNEFNNPGRNQTEFNKKRIPVGVIISALLIIIFVSLYKMASCNTPKSPVEESQSSIASEPVQESDEKHTTQPFNMRPVDQYTRERI